MGALHESGFPGLSEMRRVSNKGFENHLVFYNPHLGGIDVIRVLHGGRDLEHLFEAEETTSEE